MSLEIIIALLTVIAVGTYFQTVTGFGLGMIVMGVTSGFDLVSVPFIATVISFVTLMNSAVALPGKLHHIDWPAARAVLLGVVPSIVVGVLLLEYLSSQFARLLQFMLGAAIIYSGLVFAFRASQLKVKSSNRSFSSVVFSRVCLVVYLAWPAHRLFFTFTGNPWNWWSCAICCYWCLQPPLAHAPCL